MGSACSLETAKNGWIIFVADINEKALEKMGKNKKKTLKKMKPLMDIELKVANDPKYLVNVLIKAVETNHPKIKYRVKTSKLTGLLELIPDRAVDFIYKAAIK